MRSSSPHCLTHTALRAGNFLADESKRKRVPASVWSIFRRYFKAAREFTVFADACPACVKQMNALSEDAEAKRSIAASEKADFPRILKKSSYLSVASLLQSGMSH